MSNDACINNSRKVIFNIGSIGITGRIDVYPSSIDCSSQEKYLTKKSSFVRISTTFQILLEMIFAKRTFTEVYHY